MSRCLMKHNAHGIKTKLFLYEEEKKYSQTLTNPNQNFSFHALIAILTGQLLFVLWGGSRNKYRGSRYKRMD